MEKIPLVFALLLFLFKDLHKKLEYFDTEIISQ